MLLKRVNILELSQTAENGSTEHVDAGAGIEERDNEGVLTLLILGKDWIWNKIYFYDFQPYINCRKEQDITA